MLLPCPEAEAEFTVRTAMIAAYLVELTSVPTTPEAVTEAVYTLIPDLRPGEYRGATEAMGHVRRSRRRKGRLNA